MSISISIHVDGYYGLNVGVKNMLDLFDKYNIKASFFINMGKEAGLFKILKYRTRGIREKDIIKRYSKFQILRVLFFPRNLGNAHCKILNEIRGRGHEVNPHCWSHLLWSKNFKNININKEFFKMNKSFQKCLKDSPKGFAPPTWKWDDRILNELKNFHFNYLCINSVGKPFFKDSILLIPLSFTKTPEELLNEGFNETEIIGIYKKILKKGGFTHLYFHADYEGIRGLRLFEEILKLINHKDTQKLSKLYENE